MNTKIRADRAGDNGVALDIKPVESGGPWFIATATAGPLSVEMHFQDHEEVRELAETFEELANWMDPDTLVTNPPEEVSE